MKIKIILMLLFLTTTTLFATTYYVATNGNNSNAGTIQSPWKTLSYACSKTTKSGDVIYINPGTYIETAQSNLSEGVSIEGSGTTTIIISHVTDTYTLSLNSNSEGTDGNQHISGIVMDGNNLIAKEAIIINGRSNVKIFNCVFKNFKTLGVVFNAGTMWLNNAPTIFATGNEFHDNVMSNCAEYVPSSDNGWGNLCIGGQDGMLIYNNSITQNQRIYGYDGYCIKFYSYGYNKGVKIYDNTLISAPCYESPPAVSWGFVLESWNSLGGMEIYGNTIQGCLDIVDAMKGDYSKSFDIHDNIIGYSSINTVSSGDSNVGIHFESNGENVYIYNNYFNYLSMPIYVSAGNNSYFNDFNIYYNIIDNVGSNFNDKGWGVRITNDNNTNNFANWNIWNNVIVSIPNGKRTMDGIQIPEGTTSNVSVRNNIIQGFTNSPVDKNNSGTYNGISIENNLFYNNGNNNSPTGSATYTNYVLQNNIINNPLFISTSNYHLQSTSPAIKKGINVGLSTDHAGNSVVNPPDIGAYEYNIIVPTPITSIIVKGKNNITTITTNDGTLQMLVTILPSNATNKTVTWSVTNGTGTATINANGLLTAITDGTVTVKATANDGSGIYGSLTITISNQSGIDPPIINLNLDLVIYPIPTTNYLNVICNDITFEATKLQVYDLVGKLYINQIVINQLDDKNIYYLSLNLKSGMYIINISNNNGKLLVRNFIIY